VTQPTTRSRTITWEDPVAAAQRRAGMSGLDHLLAIRAGELPPPPIAVLMGFDLAEVDKGRAVFEVTPQEFHYNPIGVVHGGLAATLIDSATGCAVQSTLEPGVVYTSLEVKVNFARPITRDTGRVVCEGRIVHRGRTIATAEARLVADAGNKLLAHGTATCLLMAANGGAA
jgi:uncharacterized protein (TIGR00369 family)